MGQLAGCIYAIFLSVSVLWLSSHFIKFNKSADAGIWYAIWWWVAAAGALSVMVAVIVTGAVLQRIYF